jgi:phage-related protein
MNKIGAQPGDVVPVKPRHRDAWGAILGQSPYRAHPPQGRADPPPGRADPSTGRTLDKTSRRLPGVKDVVFLASSGDDLRDFPQVARQRVGYQLHVVQSGQDPSDWRPTATVGPGCAQIRVQHSGDAYRVSYVASIGDTVYVLHCSQKQGPQTAASDIELGKRYEQMSELIRARKTP